MTHVWLHLFSDTIYRRSSCFPIEISCDALKCKVWSGRDRAIEGKILGHWDRHDVWRQIRSSCYWSFLSSHQSHFSQIVPSQCLAQPMEMPLAVVRSWVEQAVFIMGQTSRCCMVCLMPQSRVSVSFEYPHFDMTSSLLTGQPSYATGWVPSRLSRGSLCQLEGVRQHWC